MPFLAQGYEAAAVDQLADVAGLSATYLLPLLPDFTRGFWR
jgi:hypothetical protein